MAFLLLGVDVPVCTVVVEEVEGVHLVWGVVLVLGIVEPITDPSPRGRRPVYEGHVARGFIGSSGARVVIGSKVGVGILGAQCDD